MRLDYLGGRSVPRSQEWTPNAFFRGSARTVGVPRPLRVMTTGQAGGLTMPYKGSVTDTP